MTLQLLGSAWHLLEQGRGPRRLALVVQAEQQLALHRSGARSPSALHSDIVIPHAGGAVHQRDAALGSLRRAAARARGKTGVRRASRRLEARRVHVRPPMTSPTARGAPGALGLGHGVRPPELDHPEASAQRAVDQRGVRGGHAFAVCR